MRKPVLIISTSIRRRGNEIAFEHLIPPEVLPHAITQNPRELANVKWIMSHFDKSEVVIIYGYVPYFFLLEAVEQTDKAIWYCEIKYGMYNNVYDIGSQWYIVECIEHGSTKEYTPALIRHTGDFTPKQMGY